MCMDIQLRTELGDLLRRDVEGGPFRSVEHAVSLLHAQESWFAEHRAENNSTEAEGFAGELIDSDWSSGE
jgi:hypothetical protein